MNIKQKTWHAACMTVCLSIAPALAKGQTFDFEDCEIGQKFTMWNVDQGNITDEAKAVAEVVADPTNPNNKVLHITVKMLISATTNYIKTRAILTKAIKDNG